MLCIIYISQNTKAHVKDWYATASCCSRERPSPYLNNQNIFGLDHRLKGIAPQIESSCGKLQCLQMGMWFCQRRKMDFNCFTNSCKYTIYILYYPFDSQSQRFFLIKQTLYRTIYSPFRYENRDVSIVYKFPMAKNPRKQYITYNWASYIHCLTSTNRYKCFHSIFSSKKKYFCWKVTQPIRLGDV